MRRRFLVARLYLTPQEELEDEESVFIHSQIS
jgi:hypothetical protein